MTEQFAGPARLRVQDILRKEIVDGMLQPGEPLFEVQLAKRLSVSRTPVREALQSLDREGLVRIVPGKGAFVSQVSLADVIELYQLRVALEGSAARIAAASPERASIRSLVGALEDARSVINEGRVDSYYEQTGQFDQAILSLVNNRRLTALLTDLWSQTRRLRRLAKLSPQRLASSIDEHLAIIQAIQDGDEARAEEATRTHLNNSRDHVLGLLGAVR